MCGQEQTKGLGSVDHFEWPASCGGHSAGMLSLVRGKYQACGKRNGVLS